MAKHKLLNSRNIYRQKQSGASYTELARKYNVAVNTIRYHIKKIESEEESGRQAQN
jgi:Mor family transcriptional regulator